MTRTTTMPDDLRDLKPPTQDAVNGLAERLMTNAGFPRRFEDSQVFKSGVWKHYDAAQQRERREKHADQLARYRETARAILTREYEARLTHKQRIEAVIAEEHAALVAELRRGYLSMPGASDADFQKALPDLLEAKRREAALNAPAREAAELEAAREALRLSGQYPL